MNATAQISRSYDNPVPTAASPVSGAINTLNNATDGLHERLTALTQRLESILAPLPPAGVGEVANKLARHSLALQIESEAGKVAAASDRIDGLLQRLEI